MKKRQAKKILRWFWSKKINHNHATDRMAFARMRSYHIRHRNKLARFAGGLERCATQARHTAWALRKLTIRCRCDFSPVITDPRNMISSSGT